MQLIVLRLLHAQLLASQAIGASYLQRSPSLGIVFLAAPLPSRSSTGNMGPATRSKGAENKTAPKKGQSNSLDMLMKGRRCYGLAMGGNFGSKAL